MVVVSLPQCNSRRCAPDHARVLQAAEEAELLQQRMPEPLRSKPGLDVSHGFLSGKPSLHSPNNNKHAGSCTVCAEAFRLSSCLLYKEVQRPRTVENWGCQKDLLLSGLHNIVQILTTLTRPHWMICADFRQVTGLPVA